MIRTVFKGILLFFLVALVAGAGAYLAVTYMIRTEETVIVPDLVGKDAMEGLKHMTDLQLDPKVEGFTCSGTIPKDHIISQDPAPGRRMKIGRDLRIVISLGPELAEIPNVSGLSLDRAILLLEEKGLAPGRITYATGLPMEKGNVFSQFPGHGEKKPRKTRVDILVSNGGWPAAFAMPDLTGKNEAEAILFLESIGLATGDITGIFIKGKPKDTVHRQSPPAGSRVLIGDEVDLTINTGRISPDNTDYGDREILLRHKGKPGLLNREIHVMIDTQTGTEQYYHGWLEPGAVFQMLRPPVKNGKIRILEDGEMVFEYDLITGEIPLTPDMQVDPKAQNTKTGF